MAVVGAAVDRFSIIINSDAEDRGDVWTPISLDDAELQLLTSNFVVDVDVAAASAAALVRLAHLKMCV